MDKKRKKKPVNGITVVEVIRFSDKVLDVGILNFKRTINHIYSKIIQELLLFNYTVNIIRKLKF